MRTQAKPLSLLQVLLVGIAILALALVGCSTGNRGGNKSADTNGMLVPVDSPSSVTQDERSTVYLVPTPTDPKGQVGIVSFGRPEIRSPSNQELLPGVQIRIAVKNDSERTWTVDTRLQEIVITDDLTLQPAYVHASAERMPLVDIPPSENRSIDLYFVIPPEYRDEADLQSFVLSWQVDTGDQLVNRVTPFDTINQVDDPVSASPFDDRQNRARRPYDRSPAADPFDPNLPMGPAPNWWVNPLTPYPYPDPR